MRIPHATRFLPTLYKALAEVTSTDDYLNMTEDEFVKAFLEASRGLGSSVQARNAYRELMTDAGLDPL